MKLYIEDTFNHITVATVTKSRPHLPVVWSDVGEAVDGGGAAELAQLAQRVLPVHVEEECGDTEDRLGWGRYRCSHYTVLVEIILFLRPRRNYYNYPVTSHITQHSRVTRDMSHRDTHN